MHGRAEPVTASRGSDHEAESWGLLDDNVRAVAEDGGLGRHDRDLLLEAAPVVHVLGDQAGGEIQLLELAGFEGQHSNGCR